MGAKTCSKCGETFPATTEHFYRWSYRPDGFKDYCKKCHNAAGKRYNNTEKGRAAAARCTAKSLADPIKKQKRYAAKYARHAVRLRTSAWYALRINLAYQTNAIVTAIAKGGMQSRGACERLFGASKLAVKLHLERQFRDGMSWQNYKLVWQVDHIKSFALAQDSNALRTLALLENIQPLLIKENAIKAIADRERIREYELSV